MVNWINKLITHNRDKAGDFGARVILHIPIGLLIGLTFPLSMGLVFLFCKYEENEDIHTQDQAWKDYFGAIVGYVVGLIIETIFIIWRYL